MYNQTRTLWKTNVGSHMWRMNRPDSDIDEFEIYIVPTRDILRGIYRQNSHQTITETVDTSRHEIGKCIDQLINGNVNFVLGVMSPIILQDSPELQELRQIYLANLSKNIYNSSHGMALSNYKKYFETGKDVSRKKLAQILRVIQFAEHFLIKKELRFEPIPPNEDISASLVKSKILELEQFKDYLSDDELPQKPNPEPYRDFLEKVRRKELNG
jgi:predicted nucleotidyltransferase